MKVTIAKVEREKPGPQRDARERQKAVKALKKRTERKTFAELTPQDKDDLLELLLVSAGLISR